MKRTVLLLLLLPFGPLLFAEPSIRLSADMDRLNLNLGSSFLEDPDGRIEPDQIHHARYQDQFRPLSKNSFGYTDSVYWVRIPVANRDVRELQWVLEYDYSVFDQITLYDASGNRLGFGGDRRPFRERAVAYRNVVFPLTEGPESASVYYLRLHTTSSMTIPLHAYAERNFVNHMSAEQILFGLYYGTMLVMLVYNLFLYMGTRDRSYLYYVSYILSYVLFQGTINGLTFQYLWPAQTWWANTCLPVFIFYSVGAGALFSRKFLRARETTPRTFLAYYFVLIYCGLGVVASFFFEYFIMIRAAILVCFPAVVLIYFNGFQCLLMGQKSARFFLIAWTMLLLGVLLYAAKSLGILPTNFVTTWSIQIGSAAEVVLLSLALADRINELSRSLQARVLELQDARTRIERSEQRFRNLFDGADEFIFTLDENLKFGAANASVSALLGFRPRDIHGLSFFDLLFQEEVGDYATLLAREKLGTLRTTGRSVSFRIAFRQKHVREPRELHVRVQLLEHDGEQELLGRAFKPEHEALFHELRLERLTFTSGNLIGNVEAIADKLTLNARSFLPEDTVNAIHMSLMEMLINAIEHGNLNVTFEEKTAAIEKQEYFDFLERRQKDPRYRDKKVLVEYTLNRRRFGVRITDEGPGFDHRRMMQASMDRLNRDRVSHGRGILLVLQVFDVVRYNDRGNQVVLIKHLDRV